eukprot:gene581-567_t
MGRTMGVQTGDRQLGVVSEYDRSPRVMSKKPLYSTEFPESVISRPHTITWLACTMAWVFLWSLTAPPMSSWWQHACGLGAAALIFLTFAGVHFPDGILIRPFPAFWRVVKGLSILYLMLLSTLMFTELPTAKEYLHLIDSNLKTGPVVEEKDYAGDCRFYTPELSHPFHNLWDRIDIFVTAHFLGWVAKALVIRGWRLLLISSLLFEWMEASLKHWLPNFNECWWDHWLLDVFGCNLAGIVVGLYLCNRFNVKKFDWRIDPPSWSTFLKNRFTFHSFDLYEWPAFLKDARTYVLLLGYIATVQLVDLNVFFLKYLLN